MASPSSPLRRWALRAVAAVLAATLGLPAAAGANLAAASRALSGCRSAMRSLERVAGRLTVATERPTNWPWFLNNQPRSGQGYESALVYALASTLGVARRDVHWIQQPYATATAPGAKTFDFDVDEIAAPAVASSAVTYSAPYYDLRTALVALTSDAIATDHGAAALRGYRYGALAGSPELATLASTLHPAQAPRSYRSMSSLLAALHAGAVDAIALDTAAALALVRTQPQVRNQAPARVVGQLPGASGHYALVFQHGNPLAGCVDQALAQLRRSGVLAQLAHRWLSSFADVPVLRP